MSSREIIRKLVADGWTLRNTRGSHHQFVHSDKPGRVTVKHPSKDIPIGTLRNIFRQAGWEWEDR
ncbi:type II toxin-antitoxin system HicA family toxin [Candidatus Palauibacter sp.]|uniref:type II toxin-antitoxin system HicA family toxin n=1 Tax=Candidatus Palauibacter sp. TaxID=3101350 RepID=UPI003B0169BD